MKDWIANIDDDHEALLKLRKIITDNWFSDISGTIFVEEIVGATRCVGVINGHPALSSDLLNMFVERGGSQLNNEVN